ncbi:phage major capsid protein [Rhodoligotrophos defluvii]|uniref:phage major capsid protein n=1 Tax=Rhodoligotrophos defluvii TaxID=2561934 RepID=UPI0010CA1A81|nr:phage major capsid protein [Rhodoligotrophos defluvii]
MPFTTAEFESMANATLDFHFKKGNILSQAIQEKPLLRAMMAKSKPFPGGKERITRRVKGEYTTTIQGFEYDDQVEYQNPANIRVASYPWKLIHAGISFTMHELLHNGISIVDTNTGRNATTHSDAEVIQLANILDDKLEDMAEGMARGMNDMFWRDGTQNAKLVPGIQSFVLENPASATVVGGIDQASNTWWRNRAQIGLNVGSDPSAQVLVKQLSKEWRQLRRYGGKPNLALAGSDFLDQLEAEMRAKGFYTQTGWAKEGGTIDVSAADPSFKGLRFEYDPTLDDMGKAKYAYLLDLRNIYPMHIDGENMKSHFPARPENKYVFYRAKTWVGGLVCDKRNSHLVISIA